MKKTILLVEDIENVRTTLKDILEEKGFAIIEATSVTDGLNKLKKNKVDAIVTDTSMPPGRDGYDFCLEIRNVLKLELPIIMYSATYEVIDPLKARKSGATDFVVKGSDPTELISSIIKTLE
jgi:DNA-binding response OmpR family regulator